MSPKPVMSTSPKPVMSTSPRSIPSTSPIAVMQSSSPAISDVSVSPSWNLNRSSSSSPARDLDRSVSPVAESHLFSSLSGEAPIRELGRCVSVSPRQDSDVRYIYGVSPERDLERPATTSPSWGCQSVQWFS